MDLNQIKQGTFKFTVQPDGSETVERFPPSKRDLDIVRYIERLHRVADGHLRSIETLQHGFHIDEVTLKDSPDPARFE
jgi:hypothetical protein